MHRFVRNMKIFSSEDLFWFQSYGDNDIIHGNFGLLVGHYMAVIHSFFTNLTLLCHQLLHMTGFQLFGVNRDGCHMWDRKCSLFPDHMISLSSGISPNILHNLLVLGLCLRINGSVLFAWISRPCHWKIVDLNTIVLNHLCYIIHN